MKVDWKTSCIVLVIAIVLVFIIKKIFFNKESDKIKQINQLLKDGLQNDRNREYQTAIYFFKKAASLIQDQRLLRDTYFAIAGSYFNLKRYTDSLKYCNKSLAIGFEDNLVALNMRFQCYSKLNNTKEYLRDLILYDSFLPTAVNKKKIEELYCTVYNEEAKKYCISNLLPYSEERYTSFFKTLIGVLPSDEEDEVVYLIKHKKYQQLDDFFLKNDYCLLKSIEKSKKSFNRNLIHASLCYLKGNYVNAINLLKTGESDFEILFLEYLMTITSKNTNGMENRFFTSTNPSIIYYLAKIYYYRKEYDEYLHLMSRLMDYSFAYYDLLVFFDEKNDETKFRDFSKEGLEIFGGDRQILYICAYHYFVTGQYELLNEIISMMSDEDPNKYFITGLTQKDKMERIWSLKRAIEVDPTHHNSYLFLTTTLIDSGNEEYRNYSSELLNKASCYDEVGQSYKVLLEIENIEYVKKNKT